MNERHASHTLCTYRGSGLQPVERHLYINSAVAQRGPELGHADLESAIP